ncbi:ferrous iron transporter B [Carboxydothermus islandicus]|uniref:Ferrous iron transporter B n=1 Tax=Carboxydothermus islandicus TaxID=661089 RepID=A0A1L8D3Y2_9THEO|nr:ferrous iron transporter B [Carboxydothermus islandicus]GAV25814.1 ferrous iron transporter B [Carboxydothermus islandicus]
MLKNRIKYPEPIEKAIAEIEKLLTVEYKLSKRSVALLLLQKDEALLSEIAKKEPHYQEILKVIDETQKQFKEPLSFVIASARQEFALKVEKEALKEKGTEKASITEFLHRLTVNPITGIPIMFLILYFGIYKFVGVFGAGTLVDLIETYFENNINPVVNQVTAQVIPWKVLQDLIANDYGIITLGIRYAVAIVLPVVTLYFLMFSILEDSGYLPRLSLLIDRAFKVIGLSGRAVIPMVLGFGCDTMATMVTRTLETNRERIIATLLLALAIPCSAQLGVILGLLSNNPEALLIWAGVMILVFLLIGYLSSQLLPGKRAGFYMEIPPLRIPKLKNILTKTYVRMKWYFIEILPLFILASVLIWIGKLTGLFDLIIKGLEPVMLWLGLPPQAAQVFLFGFFRRDYGAAGMFDLYQNGILAGKQLVVAAVTLTLFIPCIAQFSMMLKERGTKVTLAITAFILPFAFFVGYLLNLLLTVLGVNF